MIALRFKGFSHTEMLDWEVSRRERFHAWAEGLNEKDRALMKELEGKRR